MAAGRRGGAGPSYSQAPAHHVTQAGQAVAVEWPGRCGREDGAGRLGRGGAGPAAPQAVPAGAAGPQGLGAGGQRAAPVVVASAGVLRGRQGRGRADESSVLKR